MANVKATSNGSGVFSKQAAEIPHLLTHGLSREVSDVRADVAATFKPAAAMTVDEWTAPATGSTLKLSFTPKTRAGLLCVLKEIVDGAVVTTGAISSTTYTPATAPNGTHNYAVYYEYDATTIADAQPAVGPGGPGYVNKGGTGAAD